MQLPSIYTDLCLKQVFKIATASHNSHYHLVVNRVGCKLLLLLTAPVPGGSRSCSVTCNVWFTGRHLRQLKNTHTSITIDNMTHTDINSFDSKDLRNNLLR